ncbi:AlkA N-terminal domain-containing protein [Alteromonas sp. ASW11-36]|uniref:AlkA N-terminal domain-containing protein n=1 Tax=Alteromonas arenosi TaxID=3055817 RepID=A0ABT7T158_9ALTE|nr:AlkA N-terminal domain-containing protein [Alteromonas sp. ASW11-36]MDM7862173.1 AlkA N-terminal domain-containing protein [Alteromonas sp. ASW11-36]
MPLTASPETLKAARQARDPRFDGLFYIAVKTTGIFCRPICPAVSPKEENVEYFATQQESMDHGYRPCLRCRPDSAPGSPAWQGVNTTVNRATRLLIENPDQSVATIAERLGIGERYLHKLMVEHLGISPKRYRLYSQLLVAKQLLHQTTLSIESVAQAAGFSSSRSLQQHMQQVNKLTPSQLRKQTVEVKSDSIQVRLHYRPPYYWPGLRDFLSRRAISPVEQVTENSYARSFQVAGQSVAGHFKAVHNAEKNAFDVTISLPDVSQLMSIIANIRRVLDLDCDSLAIAERLQACGMPDESLTPGLRLPGVWTPFEAGCRAIIGQQISVTGAINQLQRIVTHVHNEDASEKPATFPTPQQMLTLDPDILRMPNTRKAAFKAFVECFCENQHPTPEQLLAIKGIGPWTVNYVRLRGLSEPDLLLETDLIVAKQLAKLNLESEHSAPWRSYLTFQLWELATTEHTED